MPWQLENEFTATPVSFYRSLFFENSQCRVADCQSLVPG